MDTGKPFIENIVVFNRPENVGQILDIITMSMKVILKKSAGVLL